jgi:spore coat polysaccharide biosynthesis protein SpsF
MQFLMLHVIIQARMTSTRLPGKVMLPLCEKTVLEVMLDRLKPFNENIIIATTDDGSEKPIVDLCKRLGIRYYRGDTDNVLSRYYHTALQYGAKKDDTVVRLTSDCPLIDAEIVRECIERLKQNRADYCSNVFPRTYPQGLDCEVFTFDALRRAYENAETPMEKEHVTPYIHTTHKAIFSHANVTDVEDHSAFRITLDEAADYEAIKSLYRELRCRTDFDYATLINTLHNHPEITALNAQVQQKKV